MSEQTTNQEQKDQTAKIEDLPVDDTRQDDVKGGIGLLLPAVQKVRESAG